MIDPAHFFVAGMRLRACALPPPVLVHRTSSTAHSVPRLRLELRSAESFLSSYYRVTTDFFSAIWLNATAKPRMG